jgi:hypothetical protein
MEETLISEGMIFKANHNLFKVKINKVKVIFLNMI